ncbi:DUF4817 domain-containing protein [Trichonephila clavipes]|nr:DUF4817 domain-containing protein [Trichonephila clavipes]
MTQPKKLSPSLEIEYSDVNKKPVISKIVDKSTEKAVYGTEKFKRDTLTVALDKLILDLNTRSQVYAECRGGQISLAQGPQRSRSGPGCHRRIPLSRATPSNLRIPAEDVLEYVLTDPESSVRDISKACSYSKSMVWNVLHTYGAYPFRPVLAQD